MKSDRMLSLEFVKAHPMDAVRTLENLRSSETAEFLKDLPPELAGEIIRRIDPSDVSECLALLDARKGAAMIAGLSPVIASTLLRRIDGTRRDAVLDSLPEDMAEALRLLLHYPQGSAGSLMDPRVLTVPEDITVKDAVKRVQRNPKHLIDYIYVVTRQQTLAGFISIRDLLLADPQETLSLNIIKNVGHLLPLMNYHAILLHPGWNEWHALPVVSEEGIFLGAIGYRTIRRLQRDSKEGRPSDRRSDTGSALGELYWIGLASLWKGAASAFSRREN